MQLIYTLAQKEDNPNTLESASQIYEPSGLIIIFGIAFLVFGGKKLPEIGAGLGKGITSFRKCLKEVEETVPAVKVICTLSEEVK